MKFYVCGKPVFSIERTKPVIRTFNPCSTCRFQFNYSNTNSAGCAMFGYGPLPAMRTGMCGKHGDAWQARPRVSAEQTEPQENKEPPKDPDYRTYDQVLDHEF